MTTFLAGLGVGLALGAILAVLILGRLEKLGGQMDTLTQVADRLEANVLAETGAVDSAIALIQGFAAELKAALEGSPSDQVALTRVAQLTDTVLARAQALALAVATNPLPAEPPAEPPPADNTGGDAGNDGGTPPPDAPQS